MRFIVYGAGAVGGTLAARLTIAGLEVVALARGPQFEALRRDGLRLETPETSHTTRFDVHEDPASIHWRDDDVILLCMKSQDTREALQRLRDAGVREQAVACVQNGVANERMALRVFANVHAVCVMLPCSFLQPGVVRAYSVPRPGILDIGRYPAGSDATDVAVSEAFERAGFGSRPDPEVMHAKYGKLLMNLGNAGGAAMGPAFKASPWADSVRSEGERALTAAGIGWSSVGADNERRKALMSVQPVNGENHPGSSSWQSLQRGAGSLETDYLNGEIVLLGRLHGVPTPVNAYFCELAHRMLAQGLPAGSISAAQVAAECPPGA